MLLLVALTAAADRSEEQGRLKQQEGLSRGSMLPPPRDSSIVEQDQACEDRCQNHDPLCPSSKCRTSDAHTKWLD